MFVSLKKNKSPNPDSGKNVISFMSGSKKLLLSGK